MALAGALACQKDSYLKELTTNVLSCEPATLSTVVDGKKQKLTGYNVTLQDTVLFPEGGGQPDDRGQLNDVEVLRITRKGGEALHFVPVSLDVGSEVKVTVDWTRRWDHMQQHSGQHLITAIADREFGFPTTSWYLGEKISHIELDTPSMSDAQMQQLEDDVNACVMQGLRMFPTLYDGVDDPNLRKVRTRGLPEDHVGPVRVVTIETVENNMCCGTHVSSLSHLQSIKLLCVEKGKKGKVNLVFVAGGRVLNYLGQCYSREKQLTTYLKGGPEQHPELLDKLQKSFKVAHKNSTTLLRDVAVLEAERYKSQQDRPPYLFLHRREGDGEYMNLVVSEIGDETVTVFLTTGDEKGCGLFLLAGPEQIVADVASSAGELLQGKGAVKRGRFQGKATRLSKRPHVEKLILEKLGL